MYPHVLPISALSVFHKIFSGWENLLIARDHVIEFSSEIINVSEEGISKIWRVAELAKGLLYPWIGYLKVVSVQAMYP